MADLNELTAFAAVARLRSFRKAALERGVSASALSHALRALEERLGVRLLNRTTRSVTPTEAGQQLLARLAPAMREIDDALQDLSALQDVPAGKLRLNVPRPAARLLLAPMLASFVARYPRVQVEVVTDDGMIDIVRDGFDAGIRFGEQVAADMIAVPVGAPQPFVVVASPAYLAAHGAPSTPRDLLEHACIGRRFPSGRQYAWEFEQAGEGVSIAVGGPLVFDDDELMLRAARDGAGLAYVYEADARADIAAGSLVCVLERCLPPPPRYFLYYPSRRQMPPVLRAFVDMLRAPAI
ncbi:LysR family transcriptional regulator [Janthinobacterium sp. PLB04]|uniref:LysR family transcriptional regulator n=1 Tax=Janthinobacterium lividum TaxID=29581 RepID=A0AAJ4MXQ4_9BURK|nr:MULTISPECIES: LysR family transcriptional regulator [Janthinobacterium]KAB0324797.1 LysR family transcriptional regulator [Janthinobacterium lividum]QSX98903.1 LysR family transcriptional regulator [Janthinobacterium lividum]UGQ38911.1 LysR family transcriptional regulator [Janthinobacterium sp. PLB04]